MSRYLDRLQQIFFLANIVGSVSKKANLKNHLEAFSRVVTLSILGGIITAVLLVIILSVSYIVMLNNDIGHVPALLVVIGICAGVLAVIYLMIKRQLCLIINQEKHASEPAIAEIAQSFIDGLMKRN